MENLITIYKADYYISQNITKQRITNRRTVSHYEIELYATDGNTSVINDVKHLQKKGNILIAKPGDIRYSIDPFECYCVHFSAPTHTVTDAISHLPAVFSPQSVEEIGKIFKALIDARFSRKPGRDLLLQAKTLELISTLANERCEIQPEQYAKHSKNISDACEYMAHFFDKNIALNDIARIANLSPGFFHTIFKATMKKTPREYLLQIRLSMSKNLLRNTGKSLAEIALSCGFESQAYFSYVFKKETGLSPQKYRTMKQLII